MSVEDKFKNVLTENLYIYHAFGIYGSAQGSQVYGSLGKRLKNKVIQLWKESFCNINGIISVFEVDTPIVTPAKVFEASGHVKRFTDPIAYDQDNRMIRVDEYLKQQINQALNPLDRVQDSDEIKILNGYINSPDELDNSELQDLLKKFCENGREFGVIQDANLMLSTNTSYSDRVSYLRPETAQGIFTEFKNTAVLCNETLPFGISSVGKVFRKEISPKSYTRLREFEQMEIEMFYDPEVCKDKDYDKIIENLLQSITVDLEEEIPIYTQKEQVNNESIKFVKINDCIKNRVICNPYIMYYMIKVWNLFTSKFNVKKNRLRFRQHLSRELAHYSSDCWDLEYLIRDSSSLPHKVNDNEKNWLEVVGIADRGDYDLSKHHQYSNASMMINRTLNPPKIVSECNTKLDMRVLGKSVGKLSKIYRELLNYIISQDSNLIYNLFMESTEKGGNMIEVNIDGYLAQFRDVISKKESLVRDLDKLLETLTQNKLIVQVDAFTFEFKDKEVNSESFIPHVIEPSIGLDRTIYTILNSSFWIRPEDEEQNRVVLGLANDISPFQACIIPLYTKDVMMKHISRIEKILRVNKISYIVDLSSAGIGKKYSRMDEMGIPHAITIDYQTNDDDTVTIRDRDTMKQYRLRINEIPNIDS